MGDTQTVCPKCGYDRSSAVAPAQRCPDCDGELQPIKLFARTPTKAGKVDGAVIRYASAEAQRGKWLSATYDVAGKVRAVLCSSCHRIFLYGQPREG
jgi:hypothetical protein